MRQKAVFAVVFAAVFWGVIGYFSRQLAFAGLSPLQITEVRCVITAVGMVLWLGVRKPAALRIRLRDGWLFVGTGVFSIAFFNICYFKTISLSTLSVAAILLYTAPSFVMLLSLVLFKEQLTWRKVVALVLASLGCVLVSGLGGMAQLPFQTVLWGLGAGLGYALYSIFGKLALGRYEVETVTAYTFIVAAAFLWPFSDVPVVIELVPEEPGLLWPMFGIGLLCTLLAFLLYTWGLHRMEAGRAAVLAFVEPIVATFLGIFYFREAFTLAQGMGIGLIFLSLWILNRPMGPSGAAK